MNEAISKFPPRYPIIDSRYLDASYWNSAEDFFEYLDELDAIKDELYSTKSMRGIAESLWDSAEDFPWPDWPSVEIISIRELEEKLKKCIEGIFFRNRSSLEAELAIADVDAASYRSAKIHESVPNSKIYEEPIKETLLFAWACIESGLIADDSFCLVAPEGESITIIAKNFEIAFLMSNNADGEVKTVPSSGQKSTVNYRIQVLKCSDIAASDSPLQLWEKGAYEEAIKKCLSLIQNEKRPKWMISPKCIEDFRKHNIYRSKGKEILISFEQVIKGAKDEVAILLPYFKNHYGWNLYRTHSVNDDYRTKYWRKQHLIYFSAIQKKDTKTDGTPRYLPKAYWPRKDLNPTDFN